MDTEYELRILDVEPLSIAKAVKDLGGVETKPRTLMRRYTYDTIPRERNKWMRLRDNGSDAVMTIKHVTSHDVSGTKEIEIGVSDFTKSAELISELGVPVKAYQENYRTAFSFNNCEVSIDEWPRIPAFMEVEGPTEKAVIDTLKQLGYSEEQATGQDVSTIFEQVYHIQIDDIPELKFNN